MSNDLTCKLQIQLGHIPHLLDVVKPKSALEIKKSMV